MHRVPFVHLILDVHRYIWYIKYMKYTVAEFRQNTRKILNEALKEPVTIVRFDEEFILSNAAESTEPKSTKASRPSNDRKPRVSLPKPENKAPDTPVTPSEERLANGVCKVHGLPLTEYGKCLQKGCKYA